MQSLLIPQTILITRDVYARARAHTRVPPFVRASRCLPRRVNNVGVAAMHDEFCLECRHDRKAEQVRAGTPVACDVGCALGSARRELVAEASVLTRGSGRVTVNEERGSRGTGIRIITERGEAELPSIMTQSPNRRPFPPSHHPR